MHKMILTRPSIFHQKATTEISLKDLFYCYTIHASSVIDYLYVGCLHHNFTYHKHMSGSLPFFCSGETNKRTWLKKDFRFRNMLDLDIKMFISVNMI